MDFVWPGGLMLPVSAVRTIGRIILMPMVSYWGG
jgi:hypothetical protein